MANTYQPAYMQDEEEKGVSAQNPLQQGQNPLSQGTASGSTVPGSAPTSNAISVSSENANMGVTGASTQGGTSANAAANKRSSGQFTNLQKFITANKDSDLAGKIQQNVGQQSTEARQALNTRAQEAGAAVQAQKQARENLFGTQSDRQQGIAGSAGQALTSVGQTGQRTQQAAPDLSQQEQTLTAARDFKYAGPSDIQTADLEKSRQNLNQTAKATGSEAGRFELLKGMFGNPNYTSGQQKLDNLLLQNQQGSKEKLQQVRQDARAFNSELNKTAAQTRANIAQEKQAASADVNAFAQQLGTTSETLTKDLGDRIGAVNAELAADFANFTQPEKEQILSTLGFKKNARTGEFIIGDLSSVSVPELKDIFNQVKTEASFSNFDADALARANLLNKIRGQSAVGEFDNQAKKAGIEYGLGEGYKGLSDLVGKTSPSTENQAFNSILDRGISAANLDNMVYDTGRASAAATEQMFGTQSVGGGYESMPSPQQQSQVLSQLQGFKVLSPERQAFYMNLVNKGQFKPETMNTLYEEAADKSQQVKSYLTGQNKAQVQAANNMAQYLRDYQNRNAFERDFAPKSWDNTTDYRDTNLTRANRYYE